MVVAQARNELHVGEQVSRWRRLIVLQRQTLMVVAAGRDGQVHQRISLHQSGSGGGGCGGGGGAGVVLAMVFSVRHVQLPLFGVAHHTDRCARNKADLALRLSSRARLGSGSLWASQRSSPLRHSRVPPFSPVSDTRSSRPGRCGYTYTCQRVRNTLEHRRRCVIRIVTRIVTCVTQRRPARAAWPSRTMTERRRGGESLLRANPINQNATRHASGGAVSADRITAIFARHVCNSLVSLSFLPRPSSIFLSSAPLQLLPHLWRHGDWSRSICRCASSFARSDSNNREYRDRREVRVPRSAVGLKLARCRRG